LVVFFERLKKHMQNDRSALRSYHTTVRMKFAMAEKQVAEQPKGDPADPHAARLLWITAQTHHPHGAECDTARSHWVPPKRIIAGRKPSRNEPKRCVGGFMSLRLHS
jgi:hypothetical protein